MYSILHTLLLTILSRSHCNSNSTTSLAGLAGNCGLNPSAWRYLISSLYWAVRRFSAGYFNFGPNYVTVYSKQYIISNRWTSMKPIINYSKNLKVCKNVIKTLPYKSSLIQDVWKQFQTHTCPASQLRHQKCCLFPFELCL